MQVDFKDVGSMRPDPSGEGKQQKERRLVLRALQAWDFRAGQNLRLEIDCALKTATRILPVLSPAYLWSLNSSAMFPR